LNPLRAPDSRSPRDRLGLVALVALIYLVVSGGAYGIEDAVRIAGPGLTMLLCLIIPITLSLPTALMAAELTALMPVEGGFYFWVKQALGPFAGFIEAYLTILFVIADTALYPVLFASYLGFVLPLGNAGQALIAVGLIWAAGLLNLLGVKTVGRGSITFALALLAPFVVMVLIGLPRLIHWHLPVSATLPGGLFSAWGGGLTVVIWNFTGWENVSVVAGEIENPARNYLRAIAIAVPLVALGYLLPLGVALSGGHHVNQWQTGSWVTIAAGMGGKWLATAIAAGGAVSAFAMFTAALLWVTRLPFVLAAEGYLPAGLASLWENREVPAPSIIACCLVFTLLVPLGFMTLIVFDVFFYMMALALELWALMRLRKLRPQRPGLFIIRGGEIGLYAVVIAPMLTWIATLSFAAAQSGGARDFWVGLVLAIAGVPVYLVLRRLFGGAALVKEPHIA
jgi:amino acid transporter